LLSLSSNQTLTAGTISMLDIAFTVTDH